MLKKLFEKEFVKNFLTLLSGSTIAQAILFAIIPILTRLYSEELFGLYFVFTSIVMILKIITALQLELAIVLPKDDKDAVNIIFLAQIVNLLISSLLAVLIFIFHDLINSLLGDKNLGNYLYLIPLSTFFSGFYETFNYWNNRIKKYKNISFSKIAKSTAIGGWNVSWGFTVFNNFGLIPGQIFGIFISSIFLFIISIKKISKLLKYISIKRIIFLIKKYKDIPLFNTLINFIVNISNEAPILLLTNYFGPTTVGLYGMANRIIGSPTGLISSSVGQVFFQKASETYNNKGDMYKLLKKTYLNLLKIALLIFIPALIISPFLKYILGPEWLHTGYYTMIIIPLFFLKFLNNPVSSIFTILNQQKKLIIFYICILILRISSIYIGYKIFDNPFIAIGLYVISGIIFNIILMLSFLKMAKNITK